MRSFVWKLCIQQCHCCIFFLNKCFEENNTLACCAVDTLHQGTCFRTHADQPEQTKRIRPHNRHLESSVKTKTQQYNFCSAMEKLKSLNGGETVMEYFESPASGTVAFSSEASLEALTSCHHRAVCYPGPR